MLRLANTKNPENAQYTVTKTLIEEIIAKILTPVLERERKDLIKGELVAVRADGSELRAPQAGHIVFPDANAAPGHEWFYLAGKSDRPL